MDNFETWGQDSLCKGLRIVKFKVSNIYPNGNRRLIWINEDETESFAYSNVDLEQNGWIRLDN